ncbi:response regulator transcription factor [Aminipila butyrica]|uniref:Stage 0 sporulation protein A homolog n=1 Tax=Aminipila butyrica TaxID=433296 RepID=A0A858BUQ9_9FIRM|nr:response regulator transcription factor [Aminipila butyrica]QIB68828.1 response regulator transcription factor [Aminipila butyrica]
MPKARLLLIEDNPRIQLANKDMLELLGYQVAIAMNLAEARMSLSKQVPDVVVLDIMLPDGSGLDFLRELRQYTDLPILMLTALGTTEDTVRGLSLGADDYLAKPYDYRVLAARVEALLRRAGKVPETLTKGALQFDLLANQVFLNGKDLLLTKKEFAVLLFLVKNEGRAFSSKHLYETVWKQSMVGDDGAVKNTVYRLRKKLGAFFSIQYDTNEEGYIFESFSD